MNFNRTSIIFHSASDDVFSHHKKKERKKKNFFESIHKRTPARMWINLLWLFNLEPGIVYWKYMYVMHNTAGTIDFLFLLRCSVFATIESRHWLLIQKSSAMMILSFIRSTSISFLLRRIALSYIKKIVHFQLTFFGASVMMRAFREKRKMLCCGRAKEGCN